jgi:hypothetical protein
MLSNYRTTRKLLFEKMDRKGCGLNKGTVPEFLWKD